MESFEELLLQAIKENDFQCLKFCLRKGANPNKICVCGRTPLGVAAQSGNLTIFKTLAENQKSIITYKSCSESRKNLNLDLSINNPNKANIGYFVVCRDIDENDFDEGPTPDGMEALEWDMEVTDDNSENNSSATPPEARIYKWYADVLNRTAIVLESPENDIARYDRFGLNALHYAVMQGHCDIVEYLLDNFKEIGINQSDADMFSPLQIAAYNGDVRMVKLLLEKGANIHFLNQQKHTSLHLAAQKGFVDVINILIENGANVNAQDLEDCSPLSLAVFYSHEDAAKVLIKKGTRLNHEESCGYTVLYRAVWNNMTEIARLLIEAGARVVQSHYLLHTAIRHNNFELVKMLHKAGAALNIRDEQGQTPLMIACIYSNLPIARYLLKNGALVNARNELSALTALHTCVDSIRDLKIFQQFLELLITYDADVNASSFMGNVLSYAVIVGNLNAAYTLIKYGADVNLNEDRGFVDTLTLAKKNGNIELVKLIVYAGFSFNTMLFDLRHWRAPGDDPVYGFMSAVCAQPLNLRDLCRIRIRSLLGKHLVRKIYQLPLPHVLMKYLALEEL